MSEPNLNVFLVEDDEIDAENVRRAFAETENPPTLWSARDGEEALEKLKAGEIPLQHTVILLDLNMPRMNGIEFLEALRNLPQFAHLPVVVLTTSDAEQDRVRAYGFNVAGYLLKPVAYGMFVELMGVVEAYWRAQEFP